MPTPPKPFSVLKTEKKSHRTKAELELREKGEESLLTGKKLKERPEVNRNPVAHKEFLRIVKLLEAIDKNDAVYEPVINRYCLLQAECLAFEDKREELYSLIHELKKEFKEITAEMASVDKATFLIDFTSNMAKLSASVLNIDKQIQTKRKMLLDIEKENIMTIAAALRSIPKKQEKASNPLLEALKNG